MRLLARFAAVALTAATPAALPAQTTVPGSLIILLGAEPTSPVPTLLSASQANQDVADQLFLRLARLGPELITAGDRGFQPELARRWFRRDSLTLVFELDPRARWQDGQPVTARDVVFTFRRTLEPGGDPQRAALLQYLASVTADGDRRVVFRFSRAYPEQFYDAVYHVQPLPSHLVDSIPSDRFAASDFARAPVGDGPYRWVRREPGQFVELEADPGFFLGRPGIRRLFFRVIRDPEARINALLSGDADAVPDLLPLASLARAQGSPDLTVMPVPSLSLGYLLFNQRDPADTARPHPILADRRVRQALRLALDRATMIRAVFGPYGEVPFGPVSRRLWIRDPSLRPAGVDTVAARALLRQAGWLDHDGDGLLDRDGRPLSLRLLVPASSPPRRLLAQAIQEQLRRLGVQVDVMPLEFSDFSERRRRGDFDLDLTAVTQDPTPSGIRQSWTCAGLGAGGTNVAHYCDPRVDSLIQRAIAATRNARARWAEAVSALEQDVPAVFLYNLDAVAGLHRRYRNVRLGPPSMWQEVWRWNVDPALALPRDRETS